MAYTDDWENLMNGVFGAGGQAALWRHRPAGGKAAEVRDPSAVPDLNAALLENQKQLDALLKKQNAQLKTKDDAVQSALEDSRQMLRDMEADGLLAKGTADLPAEQLGSFEGLAAEVKKDRSRAGRLCGQRGARHAPALCAGHRAPGGTQRDPDLRRCGHRAALCAGRDRPHHGGAGPFAERQNRGGGPCPLPQFRCGKAVFAGSVRGPARTRGDRDL